jgi:lipopolysaccharide/colanic/teichoic acid biosynthesis glycosyltransferase
MKEKNEADGPIFKIRNDPRITRVGKFLRKYSLDELPQLFNVIKGDMSLVGPRPLPIEQIKREDHRQLMRLEVRPGITGLWQVRGRSDISFARLVRWDMLYINNWSFWLDLNILLQTIPVVLRGKGAY